jgi:hypothetical protein
LVNPSLVDFRSLSDEVRFRILEYRLNHGVTMWGKPYKPPPPELPNMILEARAPGPRTPHPSILEPPTGYPMLGSRG